MKRRKTDKRGVSLAVTVTACALVACQPGGGRIAGGGIETETITIAGTVTDPAAAGAKPAAGARIAIRSVEFLQGPRTLPSPTTRDTLTSAQGSFQVTGLPRREYAVEATRGDSLGWFRRIAPSQSDLASLQGALEPMGAVTGRVPMPESAAVFYVQAYGIARRARVAVDGGFSLPLAEGEYVVRLASESGKYLSLEFPHLKIAAGLATAIPNLSPGDLLPKRAVPVLFDNNLATGLDDAVAMAVLHALADNGEIRILAMASVSGSLTSAPSLSAINNWYGRPEIAVGRRSEATARASDTAASPDHYPYDDYLAAHYPHADSFPTPVEAYRTALQAAEDSSVTLIVAGSLSNAYDLLVADSALVARKIKRLVALGGVYPSGLDLNFKGGLGGGPWPNATAGVLDRWPGSITFLGTELGKGVATGSCLEETPADNPVRKAAELTLGNPGKTHESLDPLAVLAAARGLAPYFTAVTVGSNRLAGDGSNAWVESPDSDQEYLIRSMPVTGLAAEVDKLLCQPRR